ncbi:hypothetical protein ACJX0J_010122, partial [Zea mays]
MLWHDFYIATRLRTTNIFEAIKKLSQLSRETTTNAGIILLFICLCISTRALAKQKRSIQLMKTLGNRNTPSCEVAISEGKLPIARVQFFLAVDGEDDDDGEHGVGDD